MAKFRSRYDFGDNKKYFESSDQESLTDQRYKTTCDLSRIVTISGDQLFIDNPEEFERNLQLADYKSMYEDVSQFGNYFDVQLALANADNCFNELPSQVRDKYDNDVGKFLTALGKADKMSAMSSAVTPTVEAEGVKTPSDSTVKE